MRRIILLFLLNVAHCITIAQTGLVWTPMSDINNQLPVEIRHYQGAGTINGYKVQAYYTITDLSTQKYIFYPLLVSSSKNVNEVYSQLGGDAVVITNGGYFSGDASYSLIINNGKTLVPNIKGLTRSFNGSNYTYYPTRSAFGLNSKFEAKVAYVYSLGVDNTAYVYPEPSPNTTDALPQPTPSTTFPAGAQVWDVISAIGGGPLLIRNGQKNTNYTPELFQSDVTTSIAPRTAIGVTSEGKLINLVIDGRQTHSDGVSLQVLSDILLELGCVEAINLDGGGSSAISINGTLINKPSDGTPRKTPTSVVIQKVAAFYDTEDPLNFKKYLSEDNISSTDKFGTSSTLVFNNQASTTPTARYKLGGIVPSEYTVEAWMNSSLNGNLSSTVCYLICRGSLGRDSIILNQNIDYSRFVTIGRFHLSETDSIVVINKGQSGNVAIDAIRLLRVGQSKPNIKLEPSLYYRNHATNELVKLVSLANTQNSGKKLDRYKIYEIIGSSKKLLYSKSGINDYSYKDSIVYKVVSSSGETKLRFVTLDFSSDSAYVEYTINVRNNLPEITFGSNSVLTGNVGTKLNFELKMSPASETRLLEQLRIYRVKDGTKTQIFSQQYNVLYANYNYEYTLKPEDIGSFKLLFEIEDNTGYIGTKDFTLQVTSIINNSLANASIWYNGIDRNIYVQLEDQAPKSTITLFLYDLQGKLLSTGTFKTGSVIKYSVFSLNTGIYIFKISSIDGSFSKALYIN